MFKSINPYTQQVIAEHPADNDQTIQDKLNGASVAFSSWKNVMFQHRGNLMKKAAVLLRKSKEQYAQMITAEMGKVIRESRSEIDKCADACDFFAERSEEFLKDQIIPTEASKSLVAHQPLGPVLAIMPWNFPFWQVFRFAAPSLMAGNVGVLKHAGNVSGCSRMIESIFKEAGFPEGVFQSLFIDSKKVEGVISHDAIAAVTLTGSE
jgi:succinate-semialdehyde dehydrogenase / glutarate-semialdehyde dehydrogenase